MGLRDLRNALIEAREMGVQHGVVEPHNTTTIIQQHKGATTASC